VTALIDDDQLAARDQLGRRGEASQVRYLVVSARDQEGWDRDPGQFVPTLPAFQVATTGGIEVVDR